MFLKFKLTLMVVLFSTSAWSVTNGLTEDEFLRSPDGGFSASQVARVTSANGTFCSGFFVSDNAMILARVCFRNGIHHISVDGVQPINYFYLNDDQSCNGNARADMGFSAYQNLFKYDVAVMIFPDGTGKPYLTNPIPLSSQSLEEGELFVLSGYGFGDYRGTDFQVPNLPDRLNAWVQLKGRSLELARNGVKRYGWNVIEKKGPYHYRVIANGFPDYSAADTPESDLGLGAGGAAEDSGAPVIGFTERGAAYISAMMDFWIGPDDYSKRATEGYYIRLDRPEIARLFHDAIYCDEATQGPCAHNFLSPITYKIAPAENLGYQVESMKTKPFSFRQCAR